MKLPSLLCAALSAAMCVANAHAQTAKYPNKPIRWIVPFPPGQASDVLARAIGAKLSESLKQPVIVDNRAGAGGNIGSEAGAKAPPDGYTLTMATAALPISKSVYTKLPFDPAKDFAAVTLITKTPLVLIVSPSLPVNSVKDLVALAKAKPGTVNFASSGPGTSHQLAGEMFKVQTGADILHVPYKGSVAAHVDIMSGRVEMMFDNIVAVLGNLKAGKLKGLAVTTPQRWFAVPDIATMAESGFPGFEAVAWFGVLAPAGTPKEVVALLHREIAQIVRMPDVRDKFVQQGIELTSSTPTELDAFLHAEIAKWARVVKASGARAD
jgi:tripartite-type tricarboxylate transporter receptor subunit TctC